MPREREREMKSTEKIPGPAGIRTLNNSQMLLPLSHWEDELHTNCIALCVEASVEFPLFPSLS